MADGSEQQAANGFTRWLRRQAIPIRRLYRIGRLDPLFLLPMFLWFSLWAAGNELTIQAMIVMLIWSTSVALYHVAIYQLLMAAVSLAMLIFIVLKWPVWVGGILVILYVVWLRRAALGKRHSPRRGSIL
jgi:hypothetical protein